MYGPRGRLGIIVPSVNSVVEPDYRRALPDDVTVYAARLKGEGAFTIAALTELAEDVERCATDLRTVSSAIAFACTSGSFVNGAEWDLSIVKTIEQASGRPGTTTSLSIINALNCLNVRKVAVATPYTDEVNERMVTYFGEYGIRVTEIKGLRVGQRGGQGVFQPGAAYTLAQEVDRPDAEAIIIACTNFRSMEIAEALEGRLRKPVITANQATLWSLLSLAGVDISIAGFGELLLAHIGQSKHENASEKTAKAVGA